MERPSFDIYTGYDPDHPQYAVVSVSPPLPPKLIKAVSDNAGFHHPLEYPDSTVYRVSSQTRVSEHQLTTAAHKIGAALRAAKHDAYVHTEEPVHVYDTSLSLLEQMAAQDNM